MRYAALLLCSACGRFGFDDAAAPADAPPDAAPCVPDTTHDEDGDGVADNCDVCPMIVDAEQPDKDGDRVGDACDPEIDKPRQRFVVFEPFTSIASWTSISTVSPGADSVKLGGIGMQGSLRRALVPATDTLAIGARSMNAGNGQQVIAIIFKELVDGRAFYCQLFDDNAAATASVIFTYTFDSVMYTHADSSPVPRLANGGGRLAFQIDPTSAKCITDWKAGDTTTMQVARPTGIDAQVVALYVENLELELDWYAQIRTDP